MAEEKGNQGKMIKNDEKQKKNCTRGEGMRKSKKKHRLSRRGSTEIQCSNAKPK